MALIKSISGIRGTIGGSAGEGLSPIDIVKFTAAYAQWLKETNSSLKHKVVVGRDARISGEMVQKLVVGTLMGYGVNVIDAGLATTPTVEVAVTMENADGGIILTASHNPKQWNALKLLNSKGEFLSDADGKRILTIAETDAYSFVNVDDLGKVVGEASYNQKHIDMVLSLKSVDVKAVKDAKLKVVVDAVNSVGGVVIPDLLEQMGVEVVKLYCEPNGLFPHNPEPLPEHLVDIANLVVQEKAHLGIVVDPDVDRLAFVCEDGSMFGEEYTLVAVADYLLSQSKGNVVSNLSSSRALKDIAIKHGVEYYASAVGEVNVVAKMKEVGAVIGGEGNGGVIYPEIHYGRDALVGVAIFLTHLAHSKKTCLEMRNSYPNYFISKNKIELTPAINVDQVLEKVKAKYADNQINDIDGVRIDIENKWVHLRKSNTEPIIRIYSEAPTSAEAEAFAGQIIADIRSICNL
ncbi:phosphoglucosamine mutase [Alistipes sp. ZOR0009]|uniref:phosphoglucosamine mutase n=1 Tax=Alistipes sp. ZOR0009 TaxID=1339253 RepID=UPI0006470D3D|nr:phosphoglucosamine mutase [Alistipes sp. ZOR0009]